MHLFFSPKKEINFENSIYSLFIHIMTDYHGTDII